MPFLEHSQPKSIYEPIEDAPDLQPPVFRSMLASASDSSAPATTSKFSTTCAGATSEEAPGDNTRGKSTLISTIPANTLSKARPN